MTVQRDVGNYNLLNDGYGMDFGGGSGGFDFSSFLDTLLTGGGDGSDTVTVIGDKIKNDPAKVLSDLASVLYNPKPAEPTDTGTTGNDKTEEDVPEVTITSDKPKKTDDSKIDPFTPSTDISTILPDLGNGDEDVPEITITSDKPTKVDPFTPSEELTTGDLPPEEPTTPDEPVIDPGEIVHHDVPPVDPDTPVTPPPVVVTPPVVTPPPDGGFVTPKADATSVQNLAGNPAGNNATGGVSGTMPGVSDTLLTMMDTFGYGKPKMGGAGTYLG